MPFFPIGARGRTASLAFMILITGATGTIGREVVRLLAAGGQTVRAMTREPARAASVPPGVEVVRADFDDPESLLAAAEGAKAVFLLSPPGPWVARHDAAMLAAAKKGNRGASIRKVLGQTRTRK